MRSVSGGSLYVTGVIFWIRTVAVAPLAAAIDSAVLVRRSCSWARTASSNVRIVPAISTLSGTMLVRIPPRIIPTVTTAGVSVRSVCRLVSVWMPRTICDAATIGSIPFQGRAPCVWRPLTVM